MPRPGVLYAPAFLSISVSPPLVIRPVHTPIYPRSETSARRWFGLRLTPVLCLYCLIFVFAEVSTTVVRHCNIAVACPLPCLKSRCFLPPKSRLEAVALPLFCPYICLAVKMDMARMWTMVVHGIVRAVGWSMAVVGFSLVSPSSFPRYVLLPSSHIFLEHCSSHCSNLCPSFKNEASYTDL